MVTGMMPLWIVTRATPRSTIADVCFAADPHQLRLQFLGGLKAEDILGWYEFWTDAEHAATEEIDRAVAENSARERRASRGR